MDARHFSGLIGLAAQVSAKVTGVSLVDLGNRIFYTWRHGYMCAA